MRNQLQPVQNSFTIGQKLCDQSFAKKYLVHLMNEQGLSMRQALGDMMFHYEADCLARDCTELDMSEEQIETLTGLMRSEACGMIDVRTVMKIVSFFGFE